MTEPTWAIVAGGGTAGHLLPGIAVARALVDAGHDPFTIHFVGAERGPESKLVPEAGFSVEVLPGRVAITALELVAVGEGQRVHHEIELAPLFPDHGQHAIDAVQILDVDLFDDFGPDRFGEGNGPAAESGPLGPSPLAFGAADGAFA